MFISFAVCTCSETTILQSDASNLNGVGKLAIDVYNFRNGRERVYLQFCSDSVASFIEAMSELWIERRYSLKAMGTYFPL